MGLRSPPEITHFAVHELKPWLFDSLCGHVVDARTSDPRGMWARTCNRAEVTCEECLLRIVIADANNIALTAMNVRSNVENVLRAAQANGQGEPAGK